MTTDAECALPNTEASNFENREAVKLQKFYVTTAIAYLNAPPHVGHAYEFITTDVLFRYHEMVGRKALFVTGTDEFGQKVANTAIKENMDPQEFCDKLVVKFYDLNRAIGIGPHLFSRTTAQIHRDFVQWLWKRAEAAGDIYFGTYQGWYSVREETFLTERDAAATDYVDPTTKLKYERRNEEAFFFRLSKYHEAVHKLVKTKGFVEPETHRNEVLARLDREPLEDLCVSRKSLQWGVPVPGNENHVTYVWFDALSNYISILGYPGGTNARYWPADIHIVGKDILWFHVVIWPAMLISAGLPLPRKVFGHGFVNAVDGLKMSKSVGNVIDPMECLTHVSSDTFRWYLVREGRYGADLKFSPAALVDMHNADLVSTLGNLVHRAVALCVKNCDAKVPAPGKNLAEYVSKISEFPRVFDKAEACMADCALEELAQLGLGICKSANKFLTDQSPWALPKEQEDEKSVIIRATLEAVYVAAHLVYPVIPKAAEQIFQRLGHPRKALCELAADGCNLQTGAEIHSGEVLFTPLTNWLQNVEN